MTLAAGARIGPYEIHSPLGAGGMGEVYRARDTKLARDVALKVLPDDVGHDAARVARFAREAQLLAALNHPHIAQIYGFEDSTETRALVMELVEGPTLADRLVHGAIPLDEALPIARQIAQALEAAHEQGIIHRDLKPANIKVRPDGTVKVLDFGLAKLLETGSGIGDPGSGRAGGAPSMLPTVTSPALITGAGMILGTAAYMAPEQARGKDVDKRGDIWAFGCVLYEMLTDRRVFDASDVSDTLAMVLMKEVDWTPLPASTPAAIRTLLRRCLEKDRKRRLPDIGVARLDIDEALAAPLSVAEAQAPRPGRQRMAWAAAAVAAAVAVAFAAVHLFEASPAPSPPIRFTVTPPAGMAPSGAGVWLSPDGRHLAFRVAPRDAPALAGPTVRLAIRSFDEPEARILPGTEGVYNAFWSPDSRFLAFFAADKLQKIDITGGPPQVLCEAPIKTGGAATGGTWNGDGTIVFGVGTPGTGAGLFRVSAGGGTPSQLTDPDPARNEMHMQPRFLPDGRRFLFVAGAGVNTGVLSSVSGNSIMVGSLDGGTPISLLRSDTEAFYADGLLLFVRDAALLAQPLDPDRLMLSGEPVVVAQDIDVLLEGAMSTASASTTGLLAYRTQQAGATESRLVWFDRAGTMLGTVGESIDQADVELSPDGNRVAVSVFDSSRNARDIWIYDLARNGLRTRFTFDAGEDWSSVWSPEGRSLIFSGGRPSPLDLYQKNADGSGSESKLVENTSGPNKYVTSWSSDGRFVLYHSGASASPMGNDLWVLPLSADRKPRALLQTMFNELNGRFSPDGRWVAYRSNESGRNEVYVMPFGAEGGKWQVSIAGGDRPRWRRDGKELFYHLGNTIMAAEVNGTGTAFQVGAVRPLFEMRRRVANYQGFGPGSPYDVTADGQRFLVNVAAVEQPAPAPITVITNWTATLR